MDKHDYSELNLNSKTFEIDTANALNVIFGSSFFECLPDKFILAVKCVGSDLHLIRYFLD